MGRQKELLHEVAEECRKKGAKAVAITADIAVESEIGRIVREAEGHFGPVDLLINNAGQMAFKQTHQYSAEEVENILRTNVYAAIRLTRAVLPSMMERRLGRIVNIGSIFGSLSFPFFGIYSATKYAIRGFSEALRREIEPYGIGVTYVAPRGTRTSQSDEFMEMAEKTGMTLDDPKKVASAVVGAIRKDRKEYYIGGPERLFVFINKLAPSMIDKGLRKKRDAMSEFA